MAIAPVELHFAGLGFFPDVAAAPRLLGRHRRRARACEVGRSRRRARWQPLGVAREAREFRPHVTLARLDSPKGLEPLREAAAKLGSPEFGRTTAREFCLYQSVLRPTGAEYTRLATFTFLWRLVILRCHPCPRNRHRQACGLVVASGRWLICWARSRSGTSSCWSADAATSADAAAATSAPPTWLASPGSSRAC